VFIINNKLEKLREKLNKDILNNISKDEILNISQKIDKEINKIMNIKNK